MSTSVRNLMAHGLILFALAVLFGLWQSSFFNQWSGTVVSYRPPVDGEAQSVRVLIVEESREKREAWWPTERVIELQLPRDPLAVPPNDLDASLPTTSKARYALHYFVRHLPEDAETTQVRAYPTTSPEGVSLTIVFFGIMMIVRNMIVSGHPFLFIAGPGGKKRKSRTAMARSPGRKARSQPGPPPSGRQRGRGRR